MRVSVLSIVLVCAGVALLCVETQAAFIVEAHESGLANQNFEGTGKASLRSYAAGTAASSSVFSGTGAEGSSDTYVYSYTPGVDVDNYFPAAGTALGNGDEATGMVGGETGFYNVYITWPSSTNVGATCTTTATSDKEDAVESGIDMNSGATPTGSNVWRRIATGIELTAGITYTVTQVPDGSAYVSMRSHGVMWEAVQPVVVPVSLIETDDATTVSEDGGTDSYSIVLDQQPTSNVYITARAHADPNNLRLNGGDPNDAVVLTFTPQNWDTPQEVLLEALDDEVFEGPHMVLVRHSSDVDPGGDPAFANGFAGYLQVHIIDNDGPAVKLTETGGDTIVVEAGTTDTYLVRLLYPPAAGTTVTVTAAVEADSPETAQAVLDAGSGPGTTIQLNFTPDDWSMDQAIAVAAVDDEDLEHVHTATILHSVASDDPAYNELAADSLTVTIEDNECGAWGYPPMDFNEDCWVDMGDFASFAEAWIQCTEPYIEACQDLR